MFKNLSLEKILAGIAVLVLIIVIALATYDKMSVNDVSVTIKLGYSEDPFVVLPKLSPEDSITNIRQNDKANNEYRVIYRTRKHRKELLERIQGGDGVKEAN